ncbi:NADH oxidoreductase (quinone), F subunit [Propionibacterium sp. oral taxon 192 str. F0372]|uniref:NADH-quinone oxidoreductase subunit NuoF n=1 Tax=Propionibacterium sp. oral taxon 192 TaxID=671222 RepID=UPI0003527FFF|nr:NADH-quinone oxidoreductase subunit NuoF [Propionibacterium sp. oral taxon 192]EPH07182.1 NADH oxidoreductase (quinone), F subunit [Propionibacterium sp. oral taxon 192 str. F0372]
MSVDTLTPNLSDNWDQFESWKLANYEARGGYKAARKALFEMTSAEIIDVVKESGLRGRGGAGFPTGMKWSFIPQDNPKPKYLVVNCDESEPGTCKDVPMLMATPHTLVEGIIIACKAVNSHQAFIYVRGEVLHVIRRLQKAVADAYQAGYLGKGIFGSDYDLDIVVHSGAGAYICGEETALLDSLEGRRGQPRLRPPFPAVAGLYASPTVVNNAESISSVPAIINNGAAWYKLMGTEKSSGATIYSVSGHVMRPGQYEAPLGITYRELLDLAGGIRPGHRLKFFTPGGSSTPILTDQHLDVALDYEGVAAAGSILGTKALQTYDETVSVVRTTLRYTEFYKHESCGKCTPCREGSWWLVQTLRNLEAGKGREGDVDKLLDVCDNVSMKSFCTLADGFVACITSAIKHFREEFEAGYHTPAWELFPYEKSVYFPDHREKITVSEVADQ